MKAVLFADGIIGLELATWVMETYREDVSLVVTTAPNALTERCESQGFPVMSAYEWESIIINPEMVAKFDVGFLLWWPSIISVATLRSARHGFYNTHPSLLPHGRGKHPNFWAIVEQSRFGVSIHRVGSGIDDGEIVAQKTIAYSWEDTGGSLYKRAAEEIISLFKITYPAIRSNSDLSCPQQLSAGSFHYARELPQKSRIDLDARYEARELLNILRARTFPGFPGAWFEDNGEKYEVNINIRRVLTDFSPVNTSSNHEAE